MTAPTQQLNPRDFEEIKNLGQGAYGTVSLVRRYSDSQQFCLKEIHLSQTQFLFVYLLSLYILFQLRRSEKRSKNSFEKLIYWENSIHHT